MLEHYHDKRFDSKRFDALANNIICGENEKKHRKELLDFLLIQENLLNIEIKKDLHILIEKIPCKSEHEINYKNNFNNWKNGKTQRINKREVKQRLEQNFYFAPSLWNMTESTVKQAIHEGVECFVKNRIQDSQELHNLFDDIRSEFHMQEGMSIEEKVVLKQLKTVSQTQMMEYIASHYPLEKHHTQDFIQALIPVLYNKGYHELLLQDVIEALDEHLKQSNHIKKIKAQIYGSPIVGEYKKAFDILSTIEFEDDIEIVEMKTEAISNIRRHYLSDNKIDTKEKQEIISKLITHYENIFNYNDTYHYYPAINIAYMFTIQSILSGDNQLTNKKIDQLYKKCKPSILNDEKSTKMQKCYYANITKLEFLLLRGVGSAIKELERYLDLESANILFVELTRTQRQMQFFVDSLQGMNHPMIENLKDSIEIIDDFMEFKQSHFCRKIL
jgi:hypothetical protein